MNTSTKKQMWHPTKAVWARARTAEKGGAARQHIGMTVQRAIEILRSHGLDPFAYGFICYDQWGELPEIRDEEGKFVQEFRPAGDRYSFRMDELLAFIAGSFQQGKNWVERWVAARGDELATRPTLSP